MIQDIKDEIVSSRQPLGYNEQPKFNSNTGLAESRKTAMLEELKKNEANFERHTDA